MPTGDRRYFIGLLTRDAVRKEEEYEKRKEQSTKSGSGKRTSTISGDALKSKIKRGEVPNN